MRSAAALLALLLAACASVPRSEPPPDTEVGVAFDRNGEIASFARGLADPRTGRAVSADDPVRIASISKLVVAIGVMKLVERHRLDLDGDVSDMLGYTVEPPGRPSPPVTLRMLLSHTSGLRDHDDQYAIPLGDRLEDVLRDPRSWDAAHPPGSGYYTYANLNFPVIASAIELAAGERFDLWMRREVLDPMKLDACFNWSTCSDAAVARAVVLLQDGKAVRDDNRERRPDCPVLVDEGEPCDLSRWRAGENGALFAPQGGLRISARGLSRVGRMLLNGGTLDGVRILSPMSVDTLLTQVWRFDGRNGFTDRGFYCSFGHATQQVPTPVAGCRDDMGTRGRTLVGHAGDAYGLKAGLWIDRARGLGIAYFVTGVAEHPPRDRSSAFSAAEARAFRRTYALLPQ